MIARQQALEHPAVLVGDWRRFYKDVRVTARTDLGGAAVYAVRAEPQEGNATAYTVSAESGLLLGSRRVALIPGLGPVGLTTRLSDYRDTGGVKMAFRVEVHYDSALLGTTVIQFDRAEIHVQTGPGAFEAPEPVSQ